MITVVAYEGESIHRIMCESIDIEGSYLVCRCVKYVIVSDAELGKILEKHNLRKYAVMAAVFYELAD